LGPKGNLIYKLVSTTDHKLIGMMSIVPMGQVAEPQDELALPYVIRLRFREGAVSDGGGGVGDEFEYLGGPGGERGVAGVELDGFAGVDTLSHLPLGLRRDHSVVGRDLIPAWLGVPRRLPGDIVEAATCERPLGCCHDQRLGVVEVLAEGVVKRVLAARRARVRPAHYSYPASSGRRL
jgi:hypothetical protein